MTFHVGQKVVCVTNEWFTEPGYQCSAGTVDPVKGQVLTIRELIWRDGPWAGLYLLFHEIRNPPGSDGCEPEYSSLDFRPLDETSIEIFRQMLVNPPRETVSA